RPGHGADRAAADGRYRGAARRRRRPRPRRRRHTAPQRRHGHRRPRGDRAALRPRGRLHPARRGLGVAAAAHPRRRVRHPADPPATPESQPRLHAVERLLPAGARGRLRRAVRLRRARPDPGRLPAPEEGRMRPAPPAERAGLRKPPPTQPAGRRGPRHPAWPRIRDVLHAEWTKLHTGPGTFWLLARAIAPTVTVSAAAGCPAGPACPVDTAKLTLTGVQLGQAVIAVLAVLAISSEYSTGMIRITLTAMPRRPGVLAAKAAVLTGLVLAAGAIAAAGSALAA